MTAPDPLPAELDAIEARNEASVRVLALTEATVAMSPEGAVRRLLAALRLALRLYAPYVTRDEYAAILAALTGQEATGGDG